MKAVEAENKNLKKDINKMKEDFECTQGLLDAQVCGCGCMAYCRHGSALTAQVHGGSRLVPCTKVASFPRLPGTWWF